MTETDNNIQWFDDNKEYDKCDEKIKLESCPYINRLRVLLHLYNKSGIAKLSEYIFKLLEKKYDSIKLYDDFHHILLKHDQDLESIMKFMNKNEVICNDETIDECKCLTRNFRNRNTFKYDEKETELIGLIQRMDLIHSYIFHSFHLSYRLTNQQQKIVFDEQKNINENENDIPKHVFDKSFDEISKIITENNVRIQKLLGNERLNDNKFVTDLSLKEERKTDENDELVDDEETKTDEIEYGFGKPFRYDEHYQYNYWYISRKYGSFKSEMLLNKFKTISKTDFICEYNKAEQFKQCSYGRNLRCHITEDYHGGVETSTLTRWDEITTNHILAVLFYCNYTTLCTNFSQTFRKLSKSESNESLKLRNREFAHFSKFLFEAVNYFGDHFAHDHDTKMDVCPIWPDSGVFHGISVEMLFSHSSGSFYNPLSTTTNYNVAINFTNHKGIMLQLNFVREASWLNVENHNFMNCAVLSDFTAESEYLFFQIKLHIDAIVMVRLKEKYAWFNKAIQVLQNVLRSDTQIKNTPDIISKHYLTYYNNIICGNTKQFPVYTNKLFQKITDQIEEVKVNVWLWRKGKYKDPFKTDYNGFSKINTLLITKLQNNKHSVDLIKLHKLCGNVERIHVFCHNWSEYETEESITLNDSFLKYVLKLNSTSLVDASSLISKIIFYVPNEKECSISEFITKYDKFITKYVYEKKKTFNAYNNYFKLKLVEEAHPHQRAHNKNLRSLCLSNPKNFDLYNFIKADDFEPFKELLNKLVENNKKFNINKRREKDGNNILLFCVKSEKNKIKFLKYLFENYLKIIDINARDNDGMTVMHLAVMNTDIELVNLLIKYGSDLNIRNNKWNTSLHMATKHYIGTKKKCDKDLLKFKPIVKSLLLLNESEEYKSQQKPADPNMLNKDNRSPMYLTLYKNIKHYDLDIANLLIVGNYDFNSDSEKQNSLLIACMLGNLKLVENILKTNKSIDIFHQRSKFYQWVFSSENEDETVLHICCRFYAFTKNENYFEIIKLLLNEYELYSKKENDENKENDEKEKDNKINEWINIKDYASFDYGRPCIWHAATMKDNKLFELLMKYKLNVNVPNENGIKFKRNDKTHQPYWIYELPNKYVESDKFERISPLTIACFVGNNYIIKQLLQQNVDVKPDSVFTKGLNSFQLCVLNGNIIGVKLIYQYLLTNKSKQEVQEFVNIAEDDTGYTAFHLACIYNHLDIVKYLVNVANVDVNIKDGYCDWKPHGGGWAGDPDKKVGLDYAKQLKHNEIVSFLSSK